MTRSGHNKDFEYIWILRDSLGLNVECNIISSAPTEGILPLLEVTFGKKVDMFTSRLRKKYGKVMVDFPFYLLEKSNIRKDTFQRLVNDCDNSPKRLFETYKKHVDIPVISANQDEPIDYNIEKNIVKEMRGLFDQIAVRARVPRYDLTTSNLSVESYKNLLSEMDNSSDILLLDIFGEVSKNIASTYKNLDYMLKLSKSHKTKTYILNAFDTVDNGHNFGPLFTAMYGIDGFGDFALEKRYPLGGSSRERKKRREIIRYYYYWDEYRLKEIVDETFNKAATQLKASNYWSNNGSHTQSCRACADIRTGVRLKTVKSDWKRFRMLHYLNSITNETRLVFTNANSSEDLDPDGYNLLFRANSSKGFPT